MTNEFPELRATVRGEHVRIIDRGPWLVDGGPLWTLIEARGRAGVAIADVSVLRDEDGLADEAIVRFLTGTGPAARRAVTEWARQVGYRRVWLSDELVELEGPGPVDSVAEVRCTGCRVVLADTGEGFWAHVRESGRFPTACPLCGCDLPQWRVRQIAAVEGDAVRPRARHQRVPRGRVIRALMPKRATDERQPLG
jgi:hypothetical protein